MSVTIDQSIHLHRPVFDLPIRQGQVLNNNLNPTSQYQTAIAIKWRSMVIKERQFMFIVESILLTLIKVSMFATPFIATDVYSTCGVSHIATLY